MSGPPLGLAGLAEPPLARVAAGGFGRVALACCVLVLAAVVVTMSGGAGFGGALDALFGTQSKARKSSSPSVRAAAPIVASPAAARPRGRAIAPVRQQRRPRQHVRKALRRSEPAPARPAPIAAAPAPAPVQPPKPPPVAPRQLERALETTTQVVVPVVPAVQPVTDQATTTVSQICGMLGGCP